jgi:hypothetical protein
MSGKRDKTKDPEDGIVRNSKLEMPLRTKSKEMATPGSIPPENKRKKKKLEHIDVPVEKAKPKKGKPKDPISEAEKVKEWTKKKLEEKKDDEDEMITVSKKELTKMLQNPLGILTAHNEKDADFVMAYMKCGNVEQALIDCEYAPKSLLKDSTTRLTLAREMMVRPEILAAVSWCKSQRLDDLIVSRDEYSDYLSQIVRGNIGDMLDENGILQPSKVKQHGKCIESYTSKVTSTGAVHISLKMRNPLGAARELAKYEGWQEKDSKTGSGGALDNEVLDTIKESNDIIDVRVEEDEKETSSSEV